MLAPWGASEKTLTNFELGAQIPFYKVIDRSGKVVVGTNYLQEALQMAQQLLADG